MRRHIKLLLGWTFLFLGALGLVLPFLQGMLFILMGILLLSGTSEWATRVEQEFSRRFPETTGKALRQIHRIKKMLRLLE